MTQFTGTIYKSLGREHQRHKHECQGRNFWGGFGGMLREILKLDISEMPYSAFPGLDFIIYDRNNDHSFPIVRVT